MSFHCSVSTNQLVEYQKSDPELSPLLQEVLCESEAAKVPICYYMKYGVLTRKWRPPTVSTDEEWQASHQIVVPNCYHADILSLAHESPLPGHLGINKMYQKVLNHFYCLGLHKDVVKFCRSSSGWKTQPETPVAPLKLIPMVEEPFSRVLVDCVGPLPKDQIRKQLFAH